MIPMVLFWHETGNLIQSNQAQGKKEERNVGSLEKSNEAVEANLSRALPISKDVYQHPIVPPGRGHPGSASVAPFSDLLVKFYSALKNQNPVSLFLVIGIAVILLLMQVMLLKTILHIILVLLVAKLVIWGENTY